MCFTVLGNIFLLLLMMFVLYIRTMLSNFGMVILLALGEMRTEISA